MLNDSQKNEKEKGEKKIYINGIEIKMILEMRENNRYIYKNNKQA